ncbi:MAG: glycoside hydrolase family 10 protein [Microcystaceae cyanobacterium]
MLTLEINQDTFFKASTQQSERLPANQKAFVAAQKTFKVKSYSKKKGHLFVILEEEISPLGNSGFFFEGHIQIEEIRAVWITNVDSDILDSSENLKKGVEKLKSLNFNTLYPVVWNRGFTLYPSAVAEKAIGSEIATKSQGRDILQEFINHAKPLGMRVIPWFEYGLMTPPNSPLTVRKPNWITQEISGNQVVNSQCWLTPAHPEVQQFMTELISDIVERYEIDGIQLDDHFATPTTMGFDDFTKQVYQRETGGRDPSNNRNASNWKKWRVNQVTNLLKQVFTEVKAISKDCIVSVSPNPLDFSIRRFAADWKTWIEEGIVEELALQVYRSNLSSFERELTKSEIKQARQQIPTVIGILTGLKPYDRRVAMNLIESQVQEVRERDFAGFSYFFYGSLLDLIPSTEKANDRELAFETLLSVDRFV